MIDEENKVKIDEFQSGGILKESECKAFIDGSPICVIPCNKFSMSDKIEIPEDKKEGLIEALKKAVESYIKAFEK